MKTSLLFLIINIFLLISNTLEAQTTYDSEMKLLAKDVSTLVKQNNKLNVAVWYFKDSFRKKTKLGRYIAQEFSVYFTNVKNGFDVMDRDEVEQVLEEHRMKENGFIDPRTAKEMGMYIHADAVITGTIDVSFRSLKIRVKLINTQTGRIIKAVMRNVPKDENIKYILHETGINTVKNIDKGRTRLKRGERYGNPQYVDQECEKKNIGDYCFENDTNKYYKINLKTKHNNTYREKNAIKTLSVGPGQSACFFDIPAKSYEYHIIQTLPSGLATLHAPESYGFIKIERCKSIIYMMSKRGN